MTRLAFPFTLAACTCLAQVAGFEIANYQIIKMPAGDSALRITDNGTITTQSNNTGYLIKNGVVTPVALPVVTPGVVYLNGMNESGDIVGQTTSIGGFTILKGLFQVTPDVDG